MQLRAERTFNHRNHTRTHIYPNLYCQSYRGVPMFFSAFFCVTVVVKPTYLRFETAVLSGCPWIEADGTTYGSTHSLQRTAGSG